MTTSVYLAGPANKITDPQAEVLTDWNWKTYALNTFLKSGITVVNPIELDLTGFVTDVNESSGSVKHSLTLIDRADSLLANIFQITESATMEMFYAHRQGKKVVVLGNEPFSPWVLFHSEARFQKLKEALDYLVSQASNLDIINWSTNFESHLKRKSEEYPPTGEADFEYYGGSLPILILAPHATNYFREGNLCRGESYTGSMAVLLSKLTGCHSIISSYCMAADPVFYLNSPFPNFLSGLIKKIPFKLVLVLHGIEWNSPHDLIFTSWNKSSLINKAEYLNLLISMFKIKDFKEIGYDSPNIVSSDVKTMSHLIFQDLGVPTIRLEINKKYRLPKLQPSLYLNLYTSLAQFLMLVGVH